MHRGSIPATFVLLSILGAAACSVSEIPTAPSADADQLSSMASITGTVNGLQEAGAAETTGASGLKISAGDDVSTSVDGSGRFSLSNVPPGVIELRVAGPGVDARLSIGAVSAGDRVEVHLTVTGNTATLDSASRSRDNEREIEGIITAIPQQGPDGRFIVNNVSVTTSGATTYTMDGRGAAFSDLVTGARVHVKATATSNNAATATAVNIQKR